MIEPVQLPLIQPSFSELQYRRQKFESKIKALEARASLRAYCRRTIEVTDQDNFLISKIKAENQYKKDVDTIHKITCEAISMLMKMTTYEEMDDLVHKFTESILIPPCLNNP